MAEIIPIDDFRTAAMQEYDTLRRRGRMHRYAISELAQADVNVFAEHCFAIHQQPIHVRWHEECDAHPFLVFWSPPEHGKTFQLGFVRLMWELGNYPTRSFAHLGSGPDIPEASLQQVAQHIVKNDRVREVFPSLRVARVGRTPTHIFGIWIERPAGHIDRDPTVIATGILKQIVGRRLDGVLLDDIHDTDNTYTRAAREKVKQRIDDEVLSRVSAEGWIRSIGHPWTKDDAGHWLAAKEGWQHRRYDVECDLEGRPGPPAALWPEAWRDPRSGVLRGWPWERIQAKKASTDHLTWWRMWKCRTPQEEMELFPLSLIRRALERGKGLQLARPCPEGQLAASGIDLATGDGHDLTVITTGYMAGGVRHVLDIRGGLWDDAKMYHELRELVRLYPRHGGFLIEDNGMQRLVVRTLRRAEVMRAYGWTDEDLNRTRVLGFTTTAKRKIDPHLGIKSLVLDLQTDQLALPSDERAHAWRQVDQLVQGMQAYDPNEPTKHTSDYLMSYWLACEMMRRLGQEGAKRLGLS